MIRREFLTTLLQSPALAFVPQTQAETRKTVRTWRKGAHLAPGFAPALVNQLGLDFVEGTDPILFDPAGYRIGSVNCRYVHRIPYNGWGSGVYSTVRQLPNFFNEWVILNEPALYQEPEQAGTMANEIVGQLVESDPNINNWIDLNFLMMPQHQDNAWRDAFWNTLTPETISKVSVLGVHVYPFSLDPVEVRTILKSIRNWQNGRGIGRFPLFLHEIGFAVAHQSQEQVAQYIGDFAAAFDSAVWLHGVSWYAYNDARTDTYVTLSNPQQDKLKKAGIAWAGL